LLFTKSEGREESCFFVVAHYCYAGSESCFFAHHCYAGGIIFQLDKRHHSDGEHNLKDTECILKGQYHEKVVGMRPSSIVD
jgi:hypothetical protein